MLIGSLAGNSFLGGFGLGASAAKVSAAKAKIAAAKKAKVKAVVKTKKAVVAAKAAKVAHVAAATAPQTVTISKDAAKRLQAALVMLGKVVGSASLKAIKVDGALGAKTASAVNLAFTAHIGAGQAPAQFRTGKLDLNTIKINAGAIASLIETEVRRRGGSVVPAATVQKGQPATKTSATSSAKKAIAAKAKATKAAIKKTAALKKGQSARQFAINEKVRAQAARQKAAALKAQAAALKKSNPAAAQTLETQADSLDAMAASADTRANAMNEEVRQAEGEAVAAEQEQAQAAAAAHAAAADATESATTATTQAVQAQAQAASEQPAATAAMVTTLPSEQTTELLPPPSGEGALSRYKVPIIVGGVGLVGLLAILMLNKKKSPAPAMAGARRHRGRR
jgi:hypothetical protein